MNSTFWRATVHYEVMHSMWRFTIQTVFTTIWQQWSSERTEQNIIGIASLENLMNSVFYLHCLKCWAVQLWFPQSHFVKSLLTTVLVELQKWGVGCCNNLILSRSSSSLMLTLKRVFVVLCPCCYAPCSLTYPVWAGFEASYFIHFVYLFCLLITDYFLWGSEK